MILLTRSISDISRKIIELVEKAPMDPKDQHKRNLLASAWEERTGNALTAGEYESIRKVYQEVIKE